MASAQWNNAVFLALGTNLGERHSNLARAIQLLLDDEMVALTRASGVYETEAVGGPPNQGDYLNAVIEIRTLLTPDALLACCNAVETSLGRQRTVPNAPRSIDLDILLFDRRVVDRPELIIPHPRMHERRFVLEPLAEIASQIIHPTLNVTVETLLTHLDGQSGACRRLDDKDWTALSRVNPC